MDCPTAGIWIKLPDTVAGGICAACHPRQHPSNNGLNDGNGSPLPAADKVPLRPGVQEATAGTAADRQLSQLVLPGPHVRAVAAGDRRRDLVLPIHAGLRAFAAWNVPVFAVAIVLVGALQHHLANLAHEAVHHTLFKNRYLNDLASEWLCSFPMFSSTFHYGLHHLAHHQFVNDPVRDPDISQLQKSGHRLSFPILKQEFMDVLFRQMWVPNLVRYSLARAEYDSLGTEHNPYIREDWEFSKLPQRLTRGVFGSARRSCSRGS